MNLISRADAVLAGQLHYFTGKACIRGHVGLRYVTTGNCVECGNERARTIAATTRQQKVIRLRPDAHEFVVVQVHADDREALFRSIDWLNAQRGRPPHPRPPEPERPVQAVEVSNRTAFERFQELHAGRYDLATIRRLAAASGIPETYSQAQRELTASQEAARSIREQLDREGYLPDELDHADKKA